MAVLALLPLVALATYTPWPFPVAVLLVSGVAGGSAAYLTGDFFLGVCFALAPACALFTLRTGSEVFGEVAASRERRAPARRRRGRRPARRVPAPLPPAVSQHERDAA